MFTTSIKLEFSFSYIAVFISIILGIITIYFSAFRSAIKASKISPIDSIRNSADIKINLKKIKSSKLIKNVFGVGGEISFKNLKRNKKKYRTTVISIVVSVFVFIALSSFMSMAFDAVESDLNISEYNLSLRAADIDEEDYKKIIETTTLNNINNYTILRQTDFKFYGNHYNQEYIDWLELDTDHFGEDYLYLTVLGEEQYNKYIKSLGLKYEDIKDKGILLDYEVVSIYDDENDKFQNKYMRIFNFNKNDIINGYLINGKEYEIEVGFITDEDPFGLKHYSGTKLIISDELFDSITTTDNVTVFYDSNNVDKLQYDIDKLLGENNYSINNTEENVRMMNNLFTLIGIFLYGFIIVISLIGITNIFNTITTCMELRRQEFAMLKSVGMTNKEFNRMIRLESLFMGIKSLLLGIPIGIILSYLIYHFLRGESGMPYKLPILGIIISIVVVFLLISLIMKYSINRINKQNIIETIRKENI